MTPDYQTFKIRQIMYIDQTMGSITGISTSTNLGKGGGKGKQYKFPPLPKLVKGDISLKFFTEQKLLIKYHKMLQQDNIKCNIGHQMMQLSNKPDYIRIIHTCKFVLTLIIDDDDCRTDESLLQISF